MIVLSIGILLIIYSLLSKDKYNLNIAFAFIFLIMGFQSNVEGDFYSYMNEYDNFHFNSSFMRKGEYFWLYLTYYFRQFTSFPVFICLMSLFECYCVKKFVERFSDKSFIFISAVLFFFTMNFMCMQMKALRQGLAVDMCLLSFVMIDNKDKKSLILAVLLSLASYFTHKSSLICIGFVWFYWLYLHNQKLRNSLITLNPLHFALAMLALYVGKKAFLDSYIIPALALLDDDHYMNYAIDFTEYAAQMNFLPIMYNTIIVSLLAWYIKYASSTERYFVMIAIVGVFVDTLVFATGSIQRLLLYFIFANLVVFPGVAMQIKSQYGKLALWAFIVLIFGYAYKTSSSFLISSEADRFGTAYKFVFMN